MCTPITVQLFVSNLFRGVSNPTGVCVVYTPLIGLDNCIILPRKFVLKFVFFGSAWAAPTGRYTLYDTRARPTMGRDAGAGVYWTVGGAQGSHKQVY